MNKLRILTKRKLKIKTPFPYQNLNSEVKSFRHQDSKFVNSTTILEQVKNQSYLWATIEDPNSVDIILELYGDRQKRLILKSTLSEPLTFSEILAICKLPRGTLYRKIASLTKAGLLVENPTNTENTCRKIPKYKTVFEEMEIVIHEDRVSIRGKLDKNLTLIRSDSLFESKRFLTHAA